MTSSNTAAEINSAISNCTSGQVVLLAAGTYNLTTGLIFNDKSGVTLRGAGPDQTKLVFTGYQGCGGYNAGICVVNGNVNWWGGPGNTANWTAGYTKGTTVVTLSSTTNLQVGTPLILDQENDSDSDNGEIWVCSTQGTCSSSGPAGAGRPGPPRREQTQTVKVTGIDGNNVTIEDPLLMPNWRSGQNPGAWWSSDTVVTGVGIEALSIDMTSASETTGIAFGNANACWVRNIRSIKTNRSHIWIVQSSHITVRDSYFYDTQNATDQSYGVEHFTSSTNLVENNIFEHIAAPIMSQSGNGSVFAYNYNLDNHYTNPDASMATSWQHGAGISYMLYEGNVWDMGLRGDYIHGPSHFTVGFRNRFGGYEAGTSQLRIPVFIQDFHRYWSILGSVLGTSGVQNTYEVIAGGSDANCHTSIFALGWGGYCVEGTTLADDTLVESTLMRWGNYDTVNDAVRWESSEVPTGGSYYTVSVPGDQVLPNSFYTDEDGVAAWWKPVTGAQPPFPPIGPDVTGGNIAGVDGYAYKIPAQQCYENNMADDEDYAGTTVRVFDADDCYEAYVFDSGTPVSSSVPGGVTFPAGGTIP